jgi:transketolase
VTAPDNSAGALFGQFLQERAERAGDTYFIKADGTLPGTDAFVAEHPECYLNVGIAEQNAVSIAAGMATLGKIVYIWNTCTFLIFRPFDQIRWDAAYLNARIRFVGSSSGLTRGPAGMAGVTLEDIGALRCMPNMTIVCPGDRLEMVRLLAQCHEVDGPVFMRLGVEREDLPLIHRPEAEITLGKASVVRPGDQAILLASGHVLPECLAMVDALAADGIRVRLVSMHTIKPFDAAAVRAMAAEGLPMLTFEDHNVIGGLGSAAAEAIAESGHGVPFKRIGIPDAYPTCQGDTAFLRGRLGVPGLEDIRIWLKENAA